MRRVWWIQMMGFSDDYQVVWEDVLGPIRSRRQADEFYRNLDDFFPTSVFRVVGR